MFKIATLNRISPCGLEEFDKKKYTYGEELENADAVLVRSASMHDLELPANLKAIARAGAGVNNIPVEKCSEQGVVVFNTPGANANAVKELVLTGLLLSSRKIVAGIEWSKTLKGKGDQVQALVEKGKSAFAGPELRGKRLGVIGLGAIGVLVANSARDLGMKVYGYDPYLSVDAAWGLSRAIIHSKSLREIYSECDYISVHVPINKETKAMINAEAIALMKDGVRVLNFSRAELVCDTDMTASLESGKVAAYVTDFPTDEIIGVEGVISIPHLGASTPESEDNCATMAVEQLIDYLENGNIRNSVNLPNVTLSRDVSNRICVIHRNIPNMLTQISGAVTAQNTNIENMLNKSRGNYAYTVLDTVQAVREETAEKIRDIEGIISVRIIAG